MVEKYLFMYSSRAFRCSKSIPQVLKKSSGTRKHAYVRLLEVLLKLQHTCLELMEDVQLLCKASYWFRKAADPIGSCADACFANAQVLQHQLPQSCRQHWLVCWLTMESSGGISTASYVACSTALLPLVTHSLQLHLSLRLLLKLRLSPLKQQIVHQTQQRAQLHSPRPSLQIHLNLDLSANLQQSSRRQQTMHRGWMQSPHLSMPGEHRLV